VKQTIRFCRSRDGVGIAYATTGQGPPLVKTANYLTHLEHDARSPVWRHWLRELSAQNTLVRYDARGSGLSDWEVDTYSIPAWVQDLEAVVDALGLESFPLLGVSQGAAVAIAYAAKHPDQVSRLVLYGGYARGRFHRDTSEAPRREAEAMITLMRVGWGKDNPALRQLFSASLMPDADQEQMDSLNELARVSATPDNASRMERAFYDIDVIDEAKAVSVPTLVMHARRDSGIPFEEGRLLASIIPKARFVALEGRNHILTESEPGWSRFVTELRSFLGADAEPAETSEPSPLVRDLSPRERQTLALIAEGLDNAQIASRLGISPKTVRNTASRVYRKLGVSNRVQAIVRARKSDDDSR